MIESHLAEFINTNISEIPLSSIFWGKVSEEIEFDNVPVINYIKVPSLASDTTPSYLDNIQITVRAKYIDTATEYTNKLVELFQLYVGMIGTYRVWITSVVVNGTIYEEEDIVASSITIGVKYTEL